MDLGQASQNDQRPETENQGVLHVPYLLRLLDSEQEHYLGCLILTVHVKTPRTKSQICWVTCWQPQSSRTDKLLLSAATPENCSSATWIQKSSLLPADTKDMDLFLTSLSSVATHCSFVLLRTGKLEQEDWRECRASRGWILGWWGGKDLSQWESLLNSCCYHRDAAQSCCSIYFLKRKLFVDVFKSFD